MRVIETKVYQFDELSEAAKEKARAWYRTRLDDDGFGWSGEVKDTLRAFCDEFPVTAKDYSYSSYDYDVMAEFTGDDDVAELSGLRLRTYLLNNFSRALYGKRYYSSKGPGAFLTRDEIARYRASSGIKRVSKIIEGETDCPFTGVCYDYSVLQPIREFIKKPDSRTFRELLQDCLDSLFSDASSEWSATYEDENVEESIRANEYEFTECGEIA